MKAMQLEHASVAASSIARKLRCLVFSLLLLPLKVGSKVVGTGYNLQPVYLNGLGQGVSISVSGDALWP